MNYVKVKISGLNLSRFITRLVSQGICATEVVIKKKYITFTISEKDLKVLDKICKIEHKFYVVISSSGVKNFLRRVPYFLGAFLALIITYSYIFSMSLYVFNVNLTYESDTEYSLSKVETYLKSQGIEPGMRKNKMSSGDIQKLLLLNIDDIEGCSVKFSGGNLNITIFPAVKKYELNLEDLISNYNGIVTFAEAYTGVLCVKPGDVVKKGDVVIKNENGASGTVKAKVYFTATKIYNEDVQEMVFTGRYLIKKDFDILNKIHIKSNKTCNFSNYLTKKCSFYITKNFFIPILCNETIFYEVEIKNKKVPFSMVEEKLKQETYSQALALIPALAEEENVTYSIVTEKNYTRIDCFIETIIDII